MYKVFLAMPRCLKSIKNFKPSLLTLGKTDSCVPSSIALNTEITEHQIFLLT